MSFRDKIILPTPLTLTGIETEYANLAYEDINALNIRTAMGLSTKTQPSKLHILHKQYQKIIGKSIQSLIELINNPSESFLLRYAAGNLVSLLGDPRINVLNPPMIAIPSATVTIGLKESEVERIITEFSQYGVQREWIEKECPTKTVFIDSFALGKYCVTNQEFLYFLQDTNYHEFPNSWPFGIYPSARANYPVYSISHDAALSYTKWLSEKTGRLFCLPSEIQWEYAATSTDGREYPWGNEFITDHCNSVESGIIDATPIGIFPAGVGPFGHMDLAGNVEEYTSDTYYSYSENKVIRDDLWLTQGPNYFVARGGSFTRFRDLCRTRRRHGKYNSELYVMGFRLAETLTGKEAVR